MDGDFKIDIVSPEKYFFSNANVKEVIVPAFEGEMGILKNHISIISFLKPGIIRVISNKGEDKFYVDDGIMEFKHNELSILTSTIFNINNIDKKFIENSLKDAEKILQNNDTNDQNRFLANEKISVLKSI